MNDNKPMRASIPIWLLFASVFSLIACNDHRGGVAADVRDEDSASIIESISENVESSLALAEEEDGKIDPMLQLNMMEPLVSFYGERQYRAAWSARMSKSPLSDSLLRFIDHCLQEGLFPEDYHHEELHLCHRLLNDSVKRRDPALWARFDLLHSDAFMRLVRDFSQGRLQPDSNSWHHDPQKIRKLFLPAMRWLLQSGDIYAIADSLEPRYPAYRALKVKLRHHLDSMDSKEYTFLDYPWKEHDSEDSIRFLQKLRLRLAEEGVTDSAKEEMDSSMLASLIYRYQKKKKWLANGLITSMFINQLNDNGLERFRRMAITLDRYKQLPDSLPSKYIWVNLPEYMLRVWEKDSVLLESKIICGKPATPTPTLSSTISNVVVLPTWTVPLSIVTKETLPELKKNAKYLARHNMYLLNHKGQKVNADTVNWNRFKKFIPYQVQQASGETNSLGLIKFNFFNSYDVYLHDTNQRYLFQKNKRALSHGCVRVQDWANLASIILAHDSATRQPPDTISGLTDSVSTWIARKSKKTIFLRHRLPLYIQYFGCAAHGGVLHFFEDIYGRDKELRNQYFADKRIIPYLKA